VGGRGWGASGWKGEFFALCALSVGGEGNVSSGRKGKVVVLRAVAVGGEGSSVLGLSLTWKGFSVAKILVKDTCGIPGHGRHLLAFT